MAKEEFPTTTIVRRVIEEHLAFSAHVQWLLDSKYAKSNGFTEWLSDVDLAVQTILVSLSREDFAAGNADSSDEAISGLEEALDGWRDIDEGVDVSADAAELLSRQFTFWHQQIRERGYMIHSLLIGSGDIIHTGKELDNLAALDYPSP